MGGWDPSGRGVIHVYRHPVRLRDYLWSYNTGTLKAMMTVGNLPQFQLPYANLAASWEGQLKWSSGACYNWPLWSRTRIAIRMLADGDMDVNHWVRLRFKSGNTKNYEYLTYTGHTPYVVCTGDCAGTRHGPPHSWGRITDAFITVQAKFSASGADNELMSGTTFHIHYLSPIDPPRRTL